jgi:type I restriction enzyme S subunit
MGEWPRLSVQDLQDSGAILVEDGNHGEYRPRPNEFTTSGFAFVRAADMDAGRVKFDSISKINDIALGRIRKGIGHPNDVLLSHKGTVGKVAWVESSAPAFVCSPQTTFYRSLDTERLDAKYLFFFLQSPEFQNQLKSRQGETDMAPYVSLTEQRRLRLALPPLSEQRAIADVLGALDDKIEANHRIETASWSLAKAQFDVLTAEPDEFEPLGSVLSLAYGKSLTAGSRVPGTTPVYGSGGVVGWHNKPLASGPGVIVGRKGTAGAVHWCQTGFFAIDTTFYVENPVVPMLFAYFLLRSLGLDHMNSDSAVPGLNRSAALGRLVPLPPESSLAEFSRSAEPLVEAADSARRENQILIALRDALLPKLLSGELRVRDVEALVEENDARILVDNTR